MTMNSVAWEAATDELYYRVSVCCSTAMQKIGQCTQPGASAAISVAELDGAVMQYHIQHAEDLSTQAVKMVLPADGEYYAVVTACQTDGMPPVKAPAEISVNFKNPYGWIPGFLWGALPWYGLMFCCYALLVAMMGLAMLVHRAYVLPLQMAVLGLAMVSTLESAMNFFMFLSKNITGVPICCPVTDDMVAAVMVGVVRSACSAVLLLAVAQGFGVVHPKLSRRVTIWLGVLFIAYILFGVQSSLDSLRNTSLAKSLWEIPLFICQAITIAGTYAALQVTRQQLAETHQTAKLAMYNTLTRVLVAIAWIWIIFTLCTIGVQVGAIPIDWRWVWLVLLAPNGLYLVGICAVAIIWRPGPRSFQYTYYAQGAANEDDAQDVEMGTMLRNLDGPSNSLATASGGLAAHAVHGTDKGMDMEEIAPQFGIGGADTDSDSDDGASMEDIDLSAVRAAAAEAASSEHAEGAGSARAPSADSAVAAAAGSGAGDSSTAPPSPGPASVTSSARRAPTLAPPRAA